MAAKALQRLGEPGRRQILCRRHLAFLRAGCQDRPIRQVSWRVYRRCLSANRRDNFRRTSSGGLYGYHFIPRRRHQRARCQKHHLAAGRPGKKTPGHAQAAGGHGQYQDFRVRPDQVTRLHAARCSREADKRDGLERGVYNILRFQIRFSDCGGGHASHHVQCASPEPGQGPSHRIGRVDAGGRRAGRRHVAAGTGQVERGTGLVHPQQRPAGGCVHPRRRQALGRRQQDQWSQCRCQRLGADGRIG
jgi:hypothetical protein